MPVFASASQAYSDVEAFKKELIQKNKLPDFAHGGSMPVATHEHVVRVKDWVQDLEKELGIKIEVVADQKEISSLVDAIPARSKFQTTLNGLIASDRIVLIANVIDTHQKALNAYEQEVVGRYGIAHYLGKRLDSVSTQIFQSMGEDKLSYLNERLGFEFDWASEADQKLAVQEHLARLAAIGIRPASEQSRISWYRAVIRRFYPKLAWTHDDLCSLIQTARNKLK